MDKNPRSPEQYRLSLFQAADRPHFAALERMVERQAFYTGQAVKFAHRTQALKNAAEEARQRFYRSLSDEDYAALVTAFHDYDREQALRRDMTNFDGLLSSAFAPAAMSAEFPSAADDLTGVMEFMVERLTSEADRVRPIETQRLANEDAALSDFGAAAEPVPVDERSPVLRDLLRTIGAMRKVIGQLDTGEAGFRSVAFHVAPIIKHISNQKLS